MEKGLDKIPCIGKIISVDRFISTTIFDPEITAGKMIFITGPHQLRRTTFAKMWHFETKKSEAGMSKSGRFYGEKLRNSLFRIVQEARKCKAFPGNCFVIPAANFLMLTG